jgi:GntR family transcriptional repressor for pyruvate dehydrogenase complex
MSPTLTEQVAQSLRQRIAAGHWSPGATLPAERTLAAELGVSRGSLRAGIAQLQAEGLLQARQGSGTRVRDDLGDAPVDWLSWILSSQDIPSSEVFEVIEQLVGLRRTVAMHVLEQAVERMSEDDLAQLKTLIDKQAESIDDPPTYRSVELRR